MDGKDLLAVIAVVEHLVVLIMFWIDTIESIKLDATQTTHGSQMFSHV